LGPAKAVHASPAKTTTAVNLRMLLSFSTRRAGS
jgi:hypothetical protein